MGPVDMLGKGMPDLKPAKLKVFAPNGDTKEVTAWVGFRNHPMQRERVELFLKHEDGTMEPLSKKVVILNTETGEVIYDPRLAAQAMAFSPFGLIDKSDCKWLKENPHWPGILELYDMPVSDGDGTGLAP